jgi:uncharacterized protein YdhG (YjbR/CyaY superfamily)
VTTVDDYLAGLAPPQRKALERVRNTVRQAVPEAEEGIHYGVPGFKLRGTYLIGYAAAKKHLSVFPTSKPIEVLQDRLGDFSTSKGTVRFTPDNPIPDELLRELVAVRVQSL